MRPTLVVLLLAACMNTVAVRSPKDASCVDTCNKYATSWLIECAVRCQGATVDATECTAGEHGCASTEEPTKFGRIAIGIGTGVGFVAAAVLSGFLVYVLVTAV